MLRADLHIHTNYSMDCDTPVEKIVEHCQKAGINCVAIADHDTVEGALKLKMMAPFIVIIAEEILTPDGEVMGMFLEERIPSGISVEDAIAQIRAQNGLVCIPHPFDRLRPSALGSKIIDKISSQIDIIEAFNSRTILRQDLARAQLFAEKHGIVQGAGSDAHILTQIGNAYIEMPEFDGREDFLSALAKGKIFGHKAGPITYVENAWAKLKKGLGLNDRR